MSAMGLAWIVTPLTRISVRGLKVFSVTGIFSSSSNVSHPSITLPKMVYLRGDEESHEGEGNGVILAGTCCCYGC